MDGFIGVIDYDIAYGGMTVKMVLEILWGGRTTTKKRNKS